MSRLSVYHESQPEHPEKVLTDAEPTSPPPWPRSACASSAGQANLAHRPGASQVEVIAAYHHEIEKLMSEEGYVTVDVISLDRNHPQKAELRAKFLDEHTHGEDEVRFFFVAGRGLFTCTSASTSTRCCARRTT